jgi:hypothetical protein
MSREQDRELLERAARAAGMVNWVWQDWPGMDIRYGVSHSLYTEATGHWNPLQSDADAFRLMVDCGVDVEYLNESVEASFWTRGADSNLLRATVTNLDDKHAATRRAIVRAAAAMSEVEQ